MLQLGDPIISIVIVNYNAGDFLRRCLTYIRQQTYPAWEVIIVDNASQDNSLAQVNGLDRVTIIRNPSNLGFAAGQNQGIAAARGQFVMALNYDLELEPDFLEKLVYALAAEPSAGWACGKLLNMLPDGTRLNTLYAAGHTLPSDRFSFLRGNGERDAGQYDRQEFVFGAPGAAALYKREMIEDIGFKGQFFDEQFFTWYEDVDLDWRATNAGWRCLYVPSSVAYHVGHVGEDYPEPYRSWRAYYGIRNRWLTIMANETISGFVRNIFGYFSYEFRCFIYVVRVGLWGAYVRALADVVRRIPSVLAKRKRIHRRPIRHTTAPGSEVWHERDLAPE